MFILIPKNGIKIPQGISRYFKAARRVLEWLQSRKVDKCQYFQIDFLIIVFTWPYQIEIKCSSFLQYLRFSIKSLVIRMGQTNLATLLLSPHEKRMSWLVLIVTIPPFSRVYFGPPFSTGRVLQRNLSKTDTP